MAKRISEFISGADQRSMGTSPIVTEKGLSPRHWAERRAYCTPIALSTGFCQVTLVWTNARIYITRLTYAAGVLMFSDEFTFIGIFF